MKCSLGTRHSLHRAQRLARLHQTSTDYAELGISVIRWRRIFSTQASRSTSYKITLVIATSSRASSTLACRIDDLRELQGLRATREIEAALAEADAWLEMSGAKSYEPFLCVERAELARLNGDAPSRERELREAHRLFLEIGAPIRAEQVAKELAG
jgi:hypothetical protein